MRQPAACGPHDHLERPAEAAVGACPASSSAARRIARIGPRSRSADPLRRSQLQPTARGWRRGRARARRPVPAMRRPITRSASSAATGRGDAGDRAGSSEPSPSMKHTIVVGRRQQPGPARRTEAPLRLVHHHGAGPGGDRRRAVGRPVVDDDRPVAGRHGLRPPTDRVRLVEHGDDDVGHGREAYGRRQADGGVRAAAVPAVPVLVAAAAVGGDHLAGGPDRPGVGPLARCAAAHRALRAPPRCSRPAPALGRGRARLAVAAAGHRTPAVAAAAARLRSRPRCSPTAWPLAGRRGVGHRALRAATSTGRCSARSTTAGRGAFVRDFVDRLPEVSDRTCAGIRSACRSCSGPRSASAARRRLVRRLVILVGTSTWSSSVAVVTRLVVGEVGGSPFGLPFLASRRRWSGSGRRPTRSFAGVVAAASRCFAVRRASRRTAGADAEAAAGAVAAVALHLTYGAVGDAVRRARWSSSCSRRWESAGAGGRRCRGGRRRRSSPPGSGGSTASRPPRPSTPPAPGRAARTGTSPPSATPLPSRWRWGRRCWWRWPACAIVGCGGSWRGAALGVVAGRRLGHVEGRGRADLAAVRALACRRRRRVLPRRGIRWWLAAQVPPPSPADRAGVAVVSGRAVLVTGGAGFIGSHVVDELVGPRTSRWSSSTAWPPDVHPTRPGLPTRSS